MNWKLVLSNRSQFFRSRLIRACSRSIIGLQPRTRGCASIQKMQGGAEWKKRYDAKFPGQFQIYSPYAYDATFVLVDAMKRASSVDPKVYLPFIAKTQYKGVTANIAFSSKGELTKPAVTLYTYKDNVRAALN